MLFGAGLILLAFVKISVKLWAYSWCFVQEHFQRQFRLSMIPADTKVWRKMYGFIDKSYTQLSLTGSQGEQYKISRPHRDAKFEVDFTSEGEIRKFEAALKHNRFTYQKKTVGLRTTRFVFTL